MKKRREPKLLRKGTKGARHYVLVVDGSRLGVVCRDPRYPDSWMARATHEAQALTGFVTRQLAVNHLVRLFYPLGL